MEYKASFDKWTNIITYSSLPLLVVALFIMWVTGAEAFANNPNTPVVFLCIIIFALLLHFVIYLFSPKKYLIDNNNLTIVRPIQNVVISLSDIREVTVLENRALRWSFRLFAVGGLFGFYGKYYHNKFGHMTWYATQRRNYVLINLKSNKKLVLTPDDLSMADALKTNIVN